jgi:hypothetical protein
MAKTTFSSGVIVTSQWLNGAQQIYFDGQDLDWHYPPLGLNSLVRTGPNGLDSAYVTLTTDQPELDGAGLYTTGSPISGTKVVTGVWNFGYDPLQAGNPVNIVANSPKSYTTNTKFQNAGSPTPPTTPPSVSTKFDSLADADIVTKLVLQQWVEDLFANLIIDNGVYYSSIPPHNCTNYSVGSGNSDTLCQL